MYTPQHQPSNALQETGAKYTTDDYLVDDLQLRNNLMDIEYKKNMYEYLEVSDVEIAYVRGNFDKVNDHSYNEITRGDAVSIILANAWKEYGGLVNQDLPDEDVFESEELNGDDHVENEEPKSKLGQDLDILLNYGKPKKKKIVDSMYDHVNGITYYFMK